MLHIILVALPAAWLAVLLSLLGWQHVAPQAVAMWQIWPEIITYRTTMLAAGPALALLGSVLLGLQVLQHRVGLTWLLDDALVGLGTALWLLGCAYTPAGSVWHWLAVPVAGMVLWPAILGTVILMLLTTEEDDLATTLIKFSGFVAAVAGLHAWVVGF